MRGVIVYRYNSKSLGVGWLLCLFSMLIVPAIVPLICLSIGFWHNDRDRCEFLLWNWDWIQSESVWLLPWYLSHYCTKRPVLVAQLLLLLKKFTVGWSWWLLFSSGSVHSTFQKLQRRIKSIDNIACNDWGLWDLTARNSVPRLVTKIVEKKTSADWISRAQFHPWVSVQPWVTLHWSSDCNHFVVSAPSHWEGVRINGL